MKKNRQERTARECALFLLEYASRTEQEMFDKLIEREYTKEEIEETMSFLKEYHYIDDAEYAKAYIRIHSSIKSKRQMQMYLQRKGIDRDLVNQELENNPVDELVQVEKFLIKKGVTSEEKLELKGKRRVVAALMRRGYSYEVIRRAIESLEKSNRTDI